MKVVAKVVRAGVSPRERAPLWITPAREEQERRERHYLTNLTSNELVSHCGRSTGKLREFILTLDNWSVSLSSQDCLTPVGKVREGAGL